MSKTVIITGATGNIGAKLRRHFSALGWRLRLLDLSNGGDPMVQEADLSLWNERWVTSFTDADALVLLAGASSSSSSWEDVQRLNIDLTLNAFEAAARQRVRRVIFASSNWTMAGHRFAEGPLPVDRAARPINPYGASKLFGERLARSYSERWGLSCISFRIGYCQAGRNQPGPHMAWGAWGQEMWLSDRDLCDGFEKAVAAPAELRFAVLNLMSDNPGMRWDIETTKRVIGFAPRDGWTANTTPTQNQGAAAAARTRAMIEAAEARYGDLRL